MSILSRVKGFFETRDNLKVPSEFLKDAFGIQSGPTGLTVNAQTATRHAAVFACCRVIGESIGSLPSKVMRRLGGGVKEIADDTSEWSVIHDAPNSEQTAFSFWENAAWSLNLRGNFFAHKRYTQGGVLGELIPIFPDDIQLDRDSRDRIYAEIIDEPRPVPYETLLHIPAMQVGKSILGATPIQHARIAVEMGLAADEYAARFWGNNATPGSLVTVPNIKDPEERKRLKETIENGFRGMKDKHRVAVMPDGITWTPMSIANKDAEFLETRKYQVTDIARIFRVPPHMIADLERATFSNVEQQSIDFVVHTIRPWLVRIEQAIKKSLFMDSDLFVQFVVDGLLRGDIETRYKAYMTAIQNGIMSPDEVREKENLNPRPDGLGGVYLRPSNMVPANQEGDQKNGESFNHVQTNGTPMLSGRGITG